MDDNALVQSARGGDEAAFASLVETYQSQVYNLAFRMLRQRQEAEDAAQETFLRAYRQLSTYHTDQRFSSWLLSIAAHYCIDQLRRRRFLWLSLEDVPVIGRLISHEPEPESAVLDSERRDEVARLLACLPPRYRLVTVLRYNYDLPTAEIATIVGSTDGAVKTQLSRARDMLATEIRKQAYGQSSTSESRSSFESASAALSVQRAADTIENQEEANNALRRPDAADIAAIR